MVWLKKLSPPMICTFKPPIFFTGLVNISPSLYETKAWHNVAPQNGLITMSHQIIFASLILSTTYVQNSRFGRLQDA